MEEKTRRRWAAMEANSIGRGGITVVSNATGWSRTTITTAMKELDEAEESVEKIRRPGGGRRCRTETEPALLEDLAKWLEPVTRGAPESPWRGTGNSTRKLAAELEKPGDRSNARKVSPLLRQMNYRLPLNRKTKEITSHPDRNVQFEQLHKMTGWFQSKGQLVIAGDAKKRELIGDFKHAGNEWRPKQNPEKVRRYDFQDDELGHGIPYGVSDITANQGWVRVGIDGNTAELAGETRRHWWHQMGVRQSNQAKELLITADGGGRNGSRNRRWKVCLQQLAAETGRKISVCHVPSGTSKWKKIEHRRFCQITPNWRGQPLVSQETMVSLSGGTTTGTGLNIEAPLEGNQYETGMKISAQELAERNLERKIFHGEWNYFSSPRNRH